MCYFIRFSDNAEVEFNLKHFSERKIIIRAIRRIPYRRGTTNTADAIRLARTEVFNGANGDRANAPNLMIVLTDGSSNDNVATLKEAELARSEGTHIISVGIGDWLNKIELESLASYPAAVNVIFAADYDTLNTLLKPLRDAICAGNTGHPLLNYFVFNKHISYLLSS